MKKKKQSIIAVSATMYLAVIVLAAFSKTAVGPSYDPWADVNDDGKINMIDIGTVAKLFGTNGTPIEKTAVQFDSGWVDISDKAGQDISVYHGLNSTDIMVDITGKTTESGGVHQKYLGSTSLAPGWNKTYGKPIGGSAKALVQTSDGGYTLAGVGFAGLVRTDAYGNLQWAKSYSGNAFAMVQTSDGGYALAGTTRTPEADGMNFWLLKTDSFGNEKWNKSYGGTYDEEAYTLVQTFDGGYALAGFTASFGAGSADFWLVKTDSLGNTQWNKTYGGEFHEEATALVQTFDGGYALTGFTMSFGEGSFDFWLVKTDSLGNTQWNNTYGTPGREDVYALLQTSDGGYALAGSTWPPEADDSDFLLVKTDSLGNTQWNKTYGGRNNPWVDYPCFDAAEALVQASDEGYVLAGITQSIIGSGGFDSWLVKTDSLGNAVWNKTYGGPGDEEATALVQTNDGGYALAGLTGNFTVPQHWDWWLVRTDFEAGFTYGLSWIDSTTDSIILYRGSTDPYWNYVRVRVWEPKQTP